MVGTQAKHLNRVLKLNDLIPELQRLESEGKLGTTAAQAKKYREAERSAKELGENFKTRFENMLEEVNQLKHKNK